MIALNFAVYNDRGAGKIDIPTNKILNESESKAIEKFIDSLGKNRQVDVGNLGIYNTATETGKEIVRDIKRKLLNK